MGLPALRMKSSGASPKGAGTKVLDTGKTVPWDDAKAYLETRALGGRARKPAAGKRRP